MQILNDKAIVATDPQFLQRIPTKSFSVIAYVDSKDKRIVDLFFAVAASSLVDCASEIRDALDAKQFRILFLREDIALDWLPEQLMKAKLAVNKLLPKLLLYSDWSVPERVMNAWADGSQQLLIANAFVTKNALVVSNCALEKFEIPFTAEVLKNIPVNERNNFKIDEIGSFIQWPAVDIDLDLESLRYLIEPDLKKKFDAERILAEQGFGYAVKGIRELNNLTQTDVESRTGISERQLRRYETDGIKPRISSLEKLAEAHRMDLNTYLEKLAKVVNGPTSIIISCKTSAEQKELCGWLSEKFTWMAYKQGRALPLFRRKGSKDHDIWNYDQRQAADELNEQLALAVRVESEDHFNAVWQLCSKKRLKPDTAIGLDRWPSIGFVPATSEYVINKLRQRAPGQENRR
jgi:transcriptional regulator with XRE-family HTH domain